MKYKAIIFDLDGTLTYTLEDLKNSVNHALKTMGWPERTLEEVRMFVGNGVRRLMEQAVPVGTKAMDFEKSFTIFKEHYVVHCQDNTRLYDGIAEMLTTLKERGYLMAIVSNKLQAGVDELYNQYFKDTIDVAIGECEGTPRKPAPEMVYKAIRQLADISRNRLGHDISKAECIYIGDSDVDLLTARNAALPCISVLWGFRDKAFLLEHGANFFAEKPEDIPTLLTLQGNNDAAD